MSKILTEISEGELLDKISILEIKLSKIKDDILLNEVKKEYEILNETKKGPLSTFFRPHHIFVKKFVLTKSLTRASILSIDCALVFFTRKKLHK